MLTPGFRLAGGIKKVNVPCKTFSWTGIVFSEIITVISRNRAQLNVAPVLAW
jgi:hypothetical protein